MKTPRPTKAETRARLLCADAHRFSGLRFIIEWKQNRNGDDCPAIIYNGRPIDRITGCGFEKESAALAGTLRHLFPTGTLAHNAVWQTEGAGPARTTAALAAHGWTLTCTDLDRTHSSYALVPAKI